MPPRQDGFEGGGESQRGASDIIGKVAAVAVAIAVIGPDLIHLLTGTLRNP